MDQLQMPLSSQPAEDSANLLLDLPVPIQQEPPLGGAPLNVPSQPMVMVGASRIQPTAGSTLLPSAAGQTQYLSLPGGPKGPVPNSASDRLALATQAAGRDLFAKMTGIPPGALANVATQPVRPRSVEYHPSSSLSMDSIKSGKSDLSRRTLPQRPAGPGYNTQTNKTDDEDTHIVLSSTDGNRGPTHSSPVEALTNSVSTMNLTGSADRAPTPELSAVLEIQTSIQTHTSIQAQVDAMDSVMVTLTNDGFTTEQMKLVKELMVDTMNQHVDKTALTLAAQQDLHADTVQWLKAEVQKWTDTTNHCWDDKEQCKRDQDQLLAQRADEHADAISALKAEQQADRDRMGADLANMTAHAQKLEVHAKKLDAQAHAEMERSRQLKSVI